MMIFSRLFPFMICTLVAGCSTMNSDFSCKVTAGDSCLTIEEVDAMTHFADDFEAGNNFKNSTHRIYHTEKLPRPYLTEKNNSQPIWFASRKGNAERVPIVTKSLQQRRQG